MGILDMDMGLLRRAVAECVGVFELVTAGCGAIMIDAQMGALGHIGVALTFGLIIMVMTAATGHISGAHLNPAVTVAFALTRHFRWREVPAYIGAQVSGALLAALTLRAIIGDVANLGATLPSASVEQAFGLEVLLTAVLMFVIIAVATDARAVGSPAAIAIGGTVALCALWGGPLSRTSMNPARSLGPALIAGIGEAQWLYVLAPLLGAAVGGLTYEFIRKPALASVQAARRADTSER
jgi:MIP family channel proteins